MPVINHRRRTLKNKPKSTFLLQMTCFVTIFNIESCVTLVHNDNRTVVTDVKIYLIKKKSLKLVLKKYCGLYTIYSGCEVHQSAKCPARNTIRTR